MSIPRVGILALQGDFERHFQSLNACGLDPCLIKRAEQFAGLNGLVLPGGESSTILKLLTNELRQALKEVYAKNMPILSTCAGTILIAETVTSPSQESLAFVPMTVERNAYGRQKESFIVEELELTKIGKERLASSEDHREGAVFIRAPKISSISDSVTVLATHADSPILVQHNNVLAATFHPELRDEPSCVYQLFATLVHDYCAVQPNN